MKDPKASKLLLSEHKRFCLSELFWQPHGPESWTSISTMGSCDVDIWSMHIALSTHSWNQCRTCI